MTCPNCRCPQVGNETFCSNCGTRVFDAGGTRRGRRNGGRWKVVAAIVAALLVLGAIHLARIHFARHRTRGDPMRSAGVDESVFSPRHRFEEVSRFPEV